jgi:small subunit ribosomal protein S8
MNLTDPIADMLTRIRNGHRARHQVVAVPHSKLKVEVARILKDEGYIRNYKVVESKPQGTIKLLLKYDEEGRPGITGIERVSKPGCRVYTGKSEVPKVFAGLGICILSTSRGVMTGERSTAQGVGGEILCNVW